MKKKIFYMFVIVAPVLFYEWLRHPLPIYEGEVVLEPLLNNVEVYTDEYGVPHVFAENEKDLFFVAGYVAARDRLFQLSMVDLAVRGSLSSVLGKKYLDTDIYLRTWGIHETAKKLVLNMDPVNKEIFDSFCAGINHRIDEVSNDLPLEFKVLNFSPGYWNPNIVAGYTRMMAHEMSGSWKPEAVFGAVESYFGKEKVMELIPGEDIDRPTISESIIKKPDIYSKIIQSEQFLRDILGDHTADIGSNNWVVSGKKTKSGNAILGNDPHLAYTQPPRWYEIHLKGGRFNVSGVCIAGIPMPVIGQNEKVAWGFTNSMVDDLDFFVEKLNPERTKYKHGSEWRDITTSRETVFVKGEKDSTIIIRKTHHGPIISDIHGLYKKSKKVLSMAWTGHWITSEMDAWVGLTTMENWSDFTSGVKGFGVPGQNIVYADVDGNIGWRPAVYIPIRKEGFSMLPRPGEDKDYDWKGRVPFEDMPFLYNPPKGYISTANNRTIDEKFPYYISGLWADPSRSVVIDEWLNNNSGINIDDMKKLQLSHRSELARNVVKRIVGLKVDNLNPGQKRAMRFLNEWDYVESPESEAALIFHTFLMKVTDNIYGDELNMIGSEYLNVYRDLKYLTNRNLRTILSGNYNSWVDNINTKGKIETIDEIIQISFFDTYNYIVDTYGPNWSNWKWGDAHKIIHKHTLGDVGIFNYLFSLNVGPFRSGGSDGTPNAGGYSRKKPFNQTSGASMRRIVDLGDLNNTQFIIPTGQSGLYNSPHYRDQSSMYHSGGYRTTHFDENYIKTSDKYRRLVFKPAI